MKDKPKTVVSGTAKPINMPDKCHCGAKYVNGWGVDPYDRAPPCEKGHFRACHICSAPLKIDMKCHNVACDEYFTRMS